MACTNPVSTAKLLMHLAPARAPPPYALPVLDFLLPRSPRRLAIPAHTATSFHSGLPQPVLGASIAPKSTSSRSAVLPSRRLREQNVSSAHVLAGSRAYSARPALARRTRQSPAALSLSHGATRHYTQAVFNSQKDEDGNEMKLDITPRAAKRLAEIMKKDSNPHLALRIQVESGGCHGFQYLMSLVTLPSTLPSEPVTTAADGEDSVVREDDTIFTYSKGEEEEAPPAEPASAPKIILDQPSLELLKGSKVDYTMELIGSQFKVVDNPMATSSCGCGTSFDLKSL